MKIQDAVINRIGDLCRKRKITLNKLANLSAISPSTLKNIMNGNSNNTGIVTIKKICDGLEITVQEFFGNLVFEDLEQEVS